jgi:hypothetical protein
MAGLLFSITISTFNDLNVQNSRIAVQHRVQKAALLPESGANLDRVQLNETIIQISH